jgi:hypothetical protein
MTGVWLSRFMNQNDRQWIGDEGYDPQIKKETISRVQSQGTGWEKALQAIDLRRDLDSEYVRNTCNLTAKTNKQKPENLIKP